MTKEEFRVQFKRLVIAGYRIPPDMPEADVMAEWYDSLAGELAEDLAVSITGLKRSKSDTFWPSIGEVYDGIGQAKRLRGFEAGGNKCEECHGNTWVTMPGQTHFNRLYPNYVARCPRCRPTSGTMAAQPVSTYGGEA